MIKRLLLCLLLPLSMAQSTRNAGAQTPIIAPVAEGDWTNWRGPNQNGIAAPSESPPIKFSAEKNVLWKSPVPGRGHSSPVIQGNRLFLTTSDQTTETQSALCYDVESGKKLWETVVLKGKLPKVIHKKNTHASPSVCCSKSQIFTVFFADDHVHLSALSLDGKKLWSVNTGKYHSRWDFGYGSSPLIVGDLVVAICDSEGEGYIAAYHQKTGQEAWRTKRKGMPMSSYSTPVLANFMGKPQILLGGGIRVAGYEPTTGKELWSVPGGPNVTASTVLWKDGNVYASGGFPQKETWATDVKNRKVIWKNKIKCYEQSLLIVKDHLYGFAEGGVLYCWELKTGKQKWRARVPSGGESSSPILAGGHIYHANEKGDIVVIKPNPNKLELVQQNKLGDEIFATPAFCRNRIYYRAASYNGNKRSETLYCISSEK